MVEREVSEQDKLRAWLRLGGARQMRRGVAGEVYSVNGPERARETAAGGKTMVAYVLDPRLKLTVRQRATGQCYGAYTEISQGGGSSEFLKIFVDGGSTGGGGATEKQIQMIRMVDCARGALIGLPDFRYKVGQSRGELKVGPHNAVTATFIADALCINGWSLDAIGILRGWWVERRDSKGHIARVVPDRQRKALAEALRVVLDGIDTAWQAKGYEVPFEIGGIEVE